MTKKNLTPDEITQEVIDAWKAEHGEVRMISVSDESSKYDPHLVPDENADIDNAVVGYLRKPNDRELSFAMSKLPVMLDAGKVLLKSCWLGGDERIKTQEPLLIAGSMEALQFLEVRRSKLVKL